MGVSSSRIYSRGTRRTSKEKAEREHLGQVIVLWPNATSAATPGRSSAWPH